jgi:DNA-directed RNA polymerase sigma subunit (sigma70/sigma32)
MSQDSDDLPDALVVAFIRSHPSGGTLEDIAAVMGVTRERVHQIEEVAMEKVCLRLYSRYRVTSVDDLINKF